MITIVGVAFTHFEVKFAFTVLEVALAHVDFEEAVEAVAAQIVKGPQEVLDEVPSREASMYVIEDGDGTHDHCLRHHEVAEVCEAESKVIPMPKHQSSQIFEPPNREVGVRTRLSPLFTDDTHTYVRLLYHVNIVGAIPDG